MTALPAEHRLLIIGGGGHARVVIDVARAAGFDPVAVLDPDAAGPTCNGVEVVGGDEMAPTFLQSGVTQAAIAIGNNSLRCTIGARLTNAGFRLPVLVHPTACISPSATIGDGAIVMPLVVINASAQIGQLVIVNSGAIIEHDCSIGDGAHIAPRSVLGGCVDVGDLAFMGIGSVARPNAQVGARTVIGAGSTVIGSVEPDLVVMGSPARVRTAS